MSRLRIILLLSLIIVVAIASTYLLRGRKDKPQYVFLICLDAVRPDHLGCYGYWRDTTPRIDQLAARGVLFEDAISQAPWTLPSIATLLTSMFPCQHGARRTDGTRIAYSGLDHAFVDNLRMSGFRTALFTGGVDIIGKIPAAELSEAALSWLREHLDYDCFISIHHYDTHSPYVASRQCIDSLDPDYRGPFRYRFGDFKMLRKARVGRLAEVIDLNEADIFHIKALYDCQILRADRSIGVIVDSLQSWDRLERSMIIVYADHGEEFLEHGSIDHGQTVYEESIKVPLIVFCPRLVKRPRRIERQVGLIDVGPTILDALNVDAPAYFEGTSLLSLITTGSNTSSERVRPCGLPLTCTISEAIARRPEKKALRRPPWKLIYDPFFGAVELYNISLDPLETENLMNVEPAVAKALTDTLLIMEKYYPGGWCIAWRSDTDESRVRGSISVPDSMVEALGHNIFPEIDPSTDSLAVSDDWRVVSFSSRAGRQWEGLEVRMTSRRPAEFDIAVAGKRAINTIVGQSNRPVEFPLTISPSEALVPRDQIHRIFDDPDVECAIYWIEPGTEPTAKRKLQEELRKQLKAIGYID